MSASRDNRPFETALDDFVMDFDRPPSHAELRDWLDRHPAYRDHPEFRAAVIHLAARWSVTDLLAAVNDVVARWGIDDLLTPERSSVPADSQRVARGREIVARVVAELAARQPITSLLAQAQAAGLTAQEAAARADLSVPLFAQLDRRLLRFDSLPSMLFMRIAGAIGRSVEDVRTYLAGPATVPHGAQFRADHAPVQAGATEDFLAAVRADPLLPVTAKRDWEGIVALERVYPYSPPDPSVL